MSCEKKIIKQNSIEAIVNRPIDEVLSFFKKIKEDNKDDDIRMDLSFDKKEIYFYKNINSDSKQDKIKNLYTSICLSKNEKFIEESEKEILQILKEKYKES